LPSGGGNGRAATIRAACSGATLSDWNHGAKRVPPLAPRRKKLQARRVRELSQRVAGAIQNRRLLAHGQKILVAVSGGADSLGLLQILFSLAPKNHWQLAVAHFNHQLRGRASTADERLVRRTAKKMRLKYFSGGADVKTFAAQSKLSIEMAARQLRHEFLARTAHAQNFSTIALAHHADDQVELFFLRLLRGAGGEGLAGMKWQSPSPADKKIRLIRPLLGCAKSDLLEFARREKIIFRADTSNLSQDFLRNRIRHELLPLLRKKYQPGLNKNILRVMEIVGAEAELVVAQASRLCVSNAGSGATAHSFARQPVALQRRILQRELAAASVPVDFDLIEQLRPTADQWTSVSPTISVARDDGGKIKLRRETRATFNNAESRLRLQSRAGRREFGGKKILWKISAAKKFQRPPKKLTGGTRVLLRTVEFFDADRIGRKIILRHWRPGDRFQPSGLKSAVKLQDLFVNAKIPAAQRRELVLATTAVGEIFWVERLRIAEPFKLTPATKHQLAWEWKPTH
jgi:tRNA(Ile)-lysidine synthase